MKPMLRRALLVPCLWALATLLAVLFVDNAQLRLAVSAPLLLFFTGYAALNAIGPIGASPAERVVYAVGASIAICLSGGFFLNWIGYLTPLGWALWLTGVTGAATAVALRRRRDPIPVIERGERPGIRGWHLTVLAAAALITYSAYAMAVRDEAAQRQFKYTEFWMLPAAPAAPGRLVIGIKSAEAAPRRFDVEVRLDGAAVALWRSIAVEPGGTWMRAMTVPDGPRPRKVEALLYDPAGNSLYRRVSAIVPGE